jgi:hypothetical protein
MDDDADVVVDAHRPEIRVLAAVDSVKMHARCGRIELNVEGRCLRRLLFGSGQPREAVGEGVGDAEIHLSAISFAYVSPDRR